MKKQIVYTHDLPIDKDELIKLFEWYDFRDPLGHKLTMSVPFLVLIDAYSASNPKGIANANPERGHVLYREYNPAADEIGDIPDDAET